MEENGRLVQFLYNEDREVVAEKDCSGNIIRYIRGLGLISSDSENAKTYYHYVSDEQGSVSHIIRDEDKESGVSAQGREQDRILNQYEYDAFGNTISCKEQVENRFRYMGEQYDPLTGQYYLRARYYNPVIARFTQEDTYYGDGLNLYTYCRNNPILNHDPTGHGTKENSPYSRKEQQYIDAGADPDTAKLATQCYPDANSKQDLYNKYKSQGYNATDAKKLANYEIVHGEERAKNYAANNVKKSGPDYTATSPRDNVNTDWRTQERLNAQKKASNSQLMPMNLQFFAAKGDESGSKSGRKTIDYIKLSDELGRKIENDGYKIIDIKDAAIANAEWADMGYDLPPVAAGTKVYNVAAGNFQYARVFKEGVNKPKSPFILRADDIQGLSAIEIAEKYALPQTPDKIVYPKIPSDVPLEISIVGPQKTWGTLGGDAQYAIKGVLLDDDWFTDIHDLK